MVERLTVELGERSYPIEIGRNLLCEPSRFARHVAGGRVCIVTNETVAAHRHLDALRAGLGNLAVDVCVLPDGEAHKTLATYAHVIDHLLQHRHGRSATLVALGGGVVGDIAGFAAATYQRGIALIQVPTTLLAQVDSSVGGKTGVNHPGGKNMIGAFHQPRLVVVDTDTLATLPRREFLAGLAEVIKYGVIVDAEFFDWLERHLDAVLMMEPHALSHAIHTCCAIKARVVGADERESDERAILNFGHTFGHAIEAVSGFGAVLHGEAVAMGMVMAADLAAHMGHWPFTDALRVKRLLERAGLPVSAPPELDPEQLLAAMAMDKKALEGSIRFVLPESLGRVTVTDHVDRAQVRATLLRGERLCHG